LTKENAQVIRRPGRNKRASPHLEALATYAELLRPVVVNLRALVEDATAPPSDRLHLRVFLRREALKKLRELEARIEVASPAP